jgi:hypothetical protein
MPERQACRHRSLRQERSASIEKSWGVTSIITTERSNGALILFGFFGDRTHSTGSKAAAETRTFLRVACAISGNSPVVRWIPALSSKLPILTASTKPHPETLAAIRDPRCSFAAS